MGFSSMDKIADEFMTVLGNVHLNSYKRNKKVFEHANLSYSQYLALDIVVRSEEIKMSDIASILDISLPAVTGLIDKLMMLGFVKKEQDDIDRRVSKIIPLNSAIQFISAINQQRKETVLEVFEQLQEDECKIYLKVMRMVEDVLNKKVSHED